MRECGIIETSLKMLEDEETAEGRVSVVNYLCSTSPGMSMSLDVQEVCDKALPKGTPLSWETQIRDDLWHAIQLASDKRS